MPVVVDCTALMLEIQSIKEYSYALYKRNIKEKQHMGIGLHWTSSPLVYLKFNRVFRIGEISIEVWRYTMIIKIVTISLMAVFYICYFAKLISQKKQGIKTDQLGKGKEGFVKFIEVALKIITYLLPVIQIISIVFYSGTAHIVLQFTGVVITMFGVLAFIVSVTQMKENWRAGVQKEEKTNLVTTGIYSISRNPAFLGFDLMYIGILFSFFNWILCFATGFAVVFFHLQVVNVEEDFLIEAFGNEYLQYKSKVCRYLGRKR